MRNKKIYIIRHGQTDYNKAGLIQGVGIDAGLNALGQQQARAFYESFKDTRFDKIYTSKLKRTTETVLPFLRRGVPRQSLEGLNEISWGNEEGQAVTDTNGYGAVVKAWKAAKLSAKIKGGESPLDVQARQELAWQYIMSNPHESQILVCMHGRAMRILLCLLLKKNLAQMDEFPHHNLCLYLLNYCAETQSYTMVLRNDIGHLSRLLCG